MYSQKEKEIIGNFKDKTFQFYGFVELIVHGASLLSLWNLMSSWVCGKSRKPKTRKTMCCEDSIFKDSFMEKEYLSFIRVNFDRCCRHFFATSLILPKIPKKRGRESMIVFENGKKSRGFLLFTKQVVYICIEFLNFLMFEF